jgi:hypothetical protein
MGQQAFTIKVYWIGAGAICRIEQKSIDAAFVGLAAEYDISSTPVFASIATNFEWVLSLVNIGNTPASRLTVQIIEKEPLSILPPDSQTVDNFGIQESKQIIFRFTVPHDAREGDCKIKIKLITTYADGCKETLFRDYSVKLQKSPMQVEIENWTYWIWIIAGLSFVAISALFNLRKRRSSLFAFRENRCSRFLSYRETVKTMGTGRFVHVVKPETIAEISVALFSSIRLSIFLD